MFKEQKRTKKGYGLQSDLLSQAVRSVFRKEPVRKDVTGKVQEFSPEENGTLRMNNGIWVAYREDLWSQQDLNKIPPGGYAIVRESEELVAENSVSQ